MRSSSSQSLACEKATEKKEKEEVQPGRELKAEISDVSLDSSRFPLMLSSPKEEKKPETTKSASILEKQKASQRMALQEAAEEAASKVAKPERRPDQCELGQLPTETNKYTWGLSKILVTFL